MGIKRYAIESFYELYYTDSNFDFFEADEKSIKR